MRADYMSKIQRRVAAISITPSAVRGKNRKGVLRAAQDYCAKLDLSHFMRENGDDFRCMLDSHTQELMVRFPPACNRDWGIARKVMNLFLRDALYDRALCEHFGLEAVGEHLEVPLDRYVAQRLRELNPNLPLWRGIVHLNQIESDKYQQFATKYASSKGLKRVDLDLYLGPFESVNNEL